ncbi:MAG: DUF2721 domain-containing protein [Arenimonas sp.]
MPAPISFGSEHYSVVSAMITPAFFLTATASLLVSSNSRLARVVDRMRQQIAELNKAQDPIECARLESRVAMHRKRARMVLHSLQMLYGAISAFVGTSLAIAVDQFTHFRLVGLPTGLAVLGVLLVLAASISLGREARLSVTMLDADIRPDRAKATGA